MNAPLRLSWQNPKTSQTGIVHSALYLGTVRHVRLAPTKHAFSMPLFMVYIDLDELAQVFALHPWWRLEKSAPAAFRRADYYGDASRPLAECVRDRVQECTGRRPTGSIRMLTHLRYLGHCFNPVTFYYCFDLNGNLDAIVSHITNIPWGQDHAYVHDARNTPGEYFRRFKLTKEFHVSPFMGMQQDYDWRFSNPSAALDVQMSSRESGRTIFHANLHLTRRTLTRTALSAVLLRYPAMTLQAVAGIHLHAAILWLKGTPYHSPPDNSNHPA